MHFKANTFHLFDINHCFVFIVSCCIVSEIASDDNIQTKTVAKRYDLDLQTCVENFDIHLDKIIRTQDSRAMGAKYINEIDLTSREECLRLCCETNTCDVFVFEEKSPGSCYLFHCGSPDDFKCKFTKHRNYTSAVLTVNRHLTELENQIKLTKHEQELTRLRRPDSDQETSTVAAYATSYHPPAQPKETDHIIVLMNSSSPVAVTASRRCSRYQFECRTSGECIAIYNACDGVPQCADGSDEAPELDCPSAGSTTPPAGLPMPTMATLIENNNGPVPLANTYNNNNNNQQPLRPETNNAASPKQQLVPGDDSQMAAPYGNGGQQYGLLPQHQQQQNEWPAQHTQQAQQYGGNVKDGNVAGNIAAMERAPPQGSTLYGREGEGYNGPGQWPGFQNQPGPPQGAAYRGPVNQFQNAPGREYQDQNSHIFNHKGNGLVSDTESPGAPYGDAPHMYNGGQGNYYKGDYHQQGQTNWQAQHQPLHDLNAMDDVQHLQEPEGAPVKSPGEGHRPGSYNNPVPPDYYYEDSQEGRFHSRLQHPEQRHRPATGHPEIGQRESITDSASLKAMDPPSSLETKLEEDLSGGSVKKDSIDVQVIETNTEEPVRATTVKTEAQVKTGHGHHSSHRKKTPSVEVNLEETEVTELEDTAESRPSGAILSLALGLCITAVMVVLVGCRLRVVRRRLRRGGKSPYAHDADFLVNGMYL